MTNTKKITLTGIGITLFVVLSLCLQVPIFQNYYLCLGYLVMMTWLINVGTASGTLVAVLGTVLYCVIIGGLRGLPGWATGNVFIGIIVGCYLNNLRPKFDRKAGKPIIIAPITDIIVMTLASAIGILLIKSFVEMVLYSQPMLVRMATNMTAFIADCATLYIGLPIAFAVKRNIKRSSYGSTAAET